MAVNFVKFERGLKSVFTTKKNNGRLSPDTLYFVYESAESTQGELYLGSRLIGGTSTSSVTSLGDLLDVDLTGSNLIDGMILHYDSLNSEWVPVSIVSAIEDAKQAGANVGGADVTVGTKNDGETLAQATSRLVSNPTEGDIAIISGFPQVYTGTTWLPLDDPSLNTRISALETDVATLQNDMAAVDGKILSANHLTYRVLTAGETLSTNLVPATQLNRTVFLVPKSNSTVGDAYDEYMYVEGSGFEKLGSWTADLSNYVTTSQFNTQVGNLNTAISNLQSNLGNYVLTTRYETEVGDIDDLTSYYNENNIDADTLVDGVLDLYDRLTWTELS